MRALLLLLFGLGSCLGARAVADCPTEPEAVSRALNALRAQAQARACGMAGQSAAMLRWNALLAASAHRHALELAAGDRIDHAGTTLRARLKESGYAMRSAAENLAGGPETLDEALALWLASPVHCENLMAAEFREFGLACVAGPGRLQRYWVLQLAEPAGLRSSPDRSP